MVEMYEVKLKNGKLYRCGKFARGISGFVELYGVGVYNFMERRWEYTGKIVFVPIHQIESIIPKEYKDLEKSKKKGEGA